jgi:hypothetical protein
MSFDGTCPDFTAVWVFVQHDLRPIVRTAIILRPAPRRVFGRIIPQNQMMRTGFAKWQEIFAGFFRGVLGVHFVPRAETRGAHVRVPGQGNAFVAHSLAAASADTGTHDFFCHKAGFIRSTGSSIVRFQAGYGGARGDLSKMFGEGDRA